MRREFSYRDGGSSFLEWVAFSALVVVILVGLVSVVPGGLASGVRVVICRIMQRSCETTGAAPDGPGATPPGRTAGVPGSSNGTGGPYRPPSDGLPDGLPPCTYLYDTTMETHSWSALLYGHSNKHMQIVYKRAPGPNSPYGVTVRELNNTGNGLDLRLGWDVDSPGEAWNIGLKLALGYQWLDQDFTDYNFKDDATRDKYNQAVADEINRDGLTNHPFELARNLTRIEDEVAQRFGTDNVRIDRYHGSGNSWLESVDGSASIFGAGPSGGVSNGGWRTVATQTNSAGETQKWGIVDRSLVASLGISIPLPLPLPKGQSVNVGADGSHENASTEFMNITYNAQGIPTHLTLMDVPWEDAGYGPSGTAGAKSGNMKGGISGKQRTDQGRGKVIQYDIDLTQDTPGESPAVVRAIQAITAGQEPNGLSVNGGQSDLAAFQDYARRHGVESERDFAVSQSNASDGWDVTIGIGIGSDQNRIDKQTFNMDGAWYYDPQTGEKKPWTGCVTPPDNSGWHFLQKFILGGGG